MFTKPAIYTISVPEYHVRTEPDHAAIGAKVDPLLRAHFLGREIVLRGLGSVEHPGKTQDELIEIIMTAGTDRYDPQRIGDRYGNIENKPIDFFGLSFNVGPDTRMFEQFTWPFYHWCKESRGFPVRVDIMTVYDPAKLERVVHTYDDGRVKDDGFIFKDSRNKPEAVLAVLRILSSDP